ncbi:acyltransferase [Poseidonibacter lekithochrous]|uniref:acyltransferase family protein n=1 Tax=Poseidonibacter TaxID=2321187 RepID=UPI001C096637|nr:MULTISPECIES: acyltransferase family protein [Poseidonibacter]MBU3014238.1 acyltransferase [Poseidonibacter lekithochrous]MDO6827535.1 acyltransferase family protein [Poseidonibacter sp. 1_MG-2023]
MNNNNNSNNFSYIAGIDSLRAFAVLSVMIFHLDASFLGGGFSGVDVFFVISGYVVSSSLYKAYKSNFKELILNFYARRILRILPPLVIMLLVFSILSTLFIPNSWLSQTNSETALAAFFGYSNFALIWFTDGYFSPRVEFNPFLHTWSLGVEEQFYVFFPLLFFIWIKYKEHPRVGIVANWLLASLFVFSLIFAWYETPLHSDRAFYLLPSRFWELAAGALLFKLHLHKNFLANSCLKSNIYMAIGLILMFSGFIFSDKGSFPFPWALLSVSGTLFLIAGIARRAENKSFLQKIFENKKLAYTGKISYSLYLWHWPIYALFRWTIGLESLFQMTLAVFLTVLFAILSYHFIELPIRKNKFILSKPHWIIISSGILIVIASYFLSKTIFTSQSKMNLSVTKEKEIWYPHRYAAPLDLKNNEKLKGKKLFVVGDSHAGAYSTMLGLLSYEYGIEIHPLSTGGCPIANLIVPGTAISEACTRNMNIMLEEIEKLASVGDTVFLASLRMNRLADQWKSFELSDPISRQLTPSAINNRKLALEETRTILQRLKEKSLDIIIDAPKPVFKSPAFRCSDWFNSSNPICKDGLTIDRKFLINYRQPVMDSLSILSKEFPQLVIWDPFVTLCPTSTCSAMDNNNPLFFDGDHLSAYGNKILYPSFKRIIEDIKGIEK